jgi:hypothetical protein
MREELMRTLLLLFLTTVAYADDLKPELRIQRRFVEKKHRFAVYAGFAYHGRADYYYTPGVDIAVSFFALESLSIDVRGDAFFSVPTSELRELASRTGYIPDTKPSRAAVQAGVRWSIGYAKLKLTATRTLHFEPQLFAYMGIHITEGPFSRLEVAPLADLGIGFLVYMTKRVQARLDAGLTIGGEQRTQYVAVVGGLPVLSLGVMF